MGELGADEELQRVPETVRPAILAARATRSTPCFLPPLTCDRPEYAQFLQYWWAYVTGVTADDIVILPTCNDLTYKPDGGFFVDPDCIQWERL